MEDQFNARLSVNKETLLWWFEKTPAQQAIFQKTKLGVPMKQWATEFCDWAKPHDARVWGNSATFDVSIAEHLIRRCGLKNPWKFWNIRCYRTLKMMMGIEKGREFTGTRHSSLDDTRHQTKCLQAFLNSNPDFDR